jgi:predicted signal transduction protein with EAL and GGDEF domain
LISAARENTDLVARFGGDEFGILCTHVRSEEEVNGIALRIVQTFTVPITTEKGEHIVGAGIGIALFPRDGNTPEEMIRRADVALYRAKSEQISSVCFFEEQMDYQVRKRVIFETQLRAAIANGDIQTFYQPIFDLKTGKITGFEALARWQHPTLGEVPPDRFILVAEDCGLIRDLGNHLLKVACLDAVSWLDDITLSFNLSPLQLRDANFGLRIISILDETGLSPKRLELEITENALVRDLKTAKAALSSLRQLGIRVSLDHFGTGYSSLYHLRNFEIDRIKIDRSFVESMSREMGSAAIVRALIGSANHCRGNREPGSACLFVERRLPGISI